jgi:hypothetical protein
MFHLGTTGNDDDDCVLEVFFKRKTVLGKTMPLRAATNEPTVHSLDDD